jgi:hypothetical protein
VLATSLALDTSFAQDLFIEMSADPKNLVLFTMRAPRTSLAGKLMATTPPPSSVTFTVTRSLALEGGELSAYHEQKRIEQEQEALEKKKDMDEDSDADEADTGGAAAGPAGASGAGDVAMKDASGALIGGGGGGGGGGARGRAMKLSAAFPMYPFVEKRRTFDLYGETINPDDYRKDTASTSEAARAKYQFMRDDQKLKPEFGRPMPAPSASASAAAAGGAGSVRSFQHDGRRCCYTIDCSTSNLCCAYHAVLCAVPSSVRVVHDSERVCADPVHQPFAGARRVCRRVRREGSQRARAADQNRRADRQFGGALSDSVHRL